MSALECLHFLTQIHLQSCLQGLTEEEKARHALHLAEAVEKMRRRGAKSETSQVQAQTAATQPKTRFWGADSPAADLPKHLLWSRKYQPSDLSEVTPDSVLLLCNSQVSQCTHQSSMHKLSVLFLIWSVLELIIGTLSSIVYVSVAAVSVSQAV